MSTSDDLLPRFRVNPSDGSCRRSAVTAPIVQAAHRLWALIRLPLQPERFVERVWIGPMLREPEQAAYSQPIFRNLLWDHRFAKRLRRPI